MDNNYTPQHVKDKIVQEMLSQLMPPQYDLDPYSLDSSPYYENDIFKPVKEPVSANKLKPASHTSKPAYKKAKHPKELKPASKSMLLQESPGTKAKVLGEKYVAGILEKYGCEVAIMQKGFGYDLLVLSADRNDIARFNVIVDRTPFNKGIEIETYRIDSNEVLSDITNGLPDCYIFVICGTAGVYHISTEKLRALIKNQNAHEFIIETDTGEYKYCEINRQLLLNNSRHLNSRAPHTK